MLIEIDVKEKVAHDFFERFFSFQNLKKISNDEKPPICQQITDKLFGKVEWHCFALKLHCLRSQPCSFYHLPLFQPVGSRGEGKKKNEAKD